MLSLPPGPSGAQLSSVFTTILVYHALLIGVGVWAARRTRSTEDFFLAGRGLGAWAASLSASASSSSAWTLLGVSGAAYAWGLKAVWIFPAVVGGFVINWFWVGPRLMRLAEETGAITLPELLFGRDSDSVRLLRAAAIIIGISFIFYIAAQFQAAGQAFTAAFDWRADVSIAVGAGIILVYTLLGGFWAASVTDAIQGAVMFLVALALPFGTLAFVGGFEQLMIGLEATGGADAVSLTGAQAGAAGLAFIAGTLGIGLGYPGQPHVLNRYMALRDDKALRRGRIIAMTWVVVVIGGMLVLGLAARLMYSTIADPEQTLFFVGERMLGPAISGLVIAAVLSAIMSTADSQLLVTASSAAHDWDRPDEAQRLVRSRVMLVVATILAAALALFAPESIFNRVLFAWHALAAAFGPLVLLRISGFRVDGNHALAAMLSGSLLTVIFHWFPNTPGDFVERLAPLVVAAIVAWRGRLRE